MFYLMCMNIIEWKWSFVLSFFSFKINVISIIDTIIISCWRSAKISLIYHSFTTFRIVNINYLNRSWLFMNNCYATFKIESIRLFNIFLKCHTSSTIFNITWKWRILTSVQRLIFRVWFTIWIIHHNSPHKFVPILYLMIF